ncbi:MAG: hypothetical protein M3347_07085, partial [Armatimonadota bacterium]|nr:hypothetical protein [Armatimonadota bacterium]
MAVQTLPVLAAPTPAVSTTLPNGITLITRTDYTSPRVAISLVARAGAAGETPATAGWRRLLTDAMLRATLRDDSARSTSNAGGSSAGANNADAPAR